LIGLQADRHWPDVCRAIGREDLIESERTKDIVRRRENAGFVVGLLDEIFATRTRAEWGELFDAAGVWWAPVQDCNDLAQDAQLRATGGVVPFESGEGLPEQVATPVDFSGTPNVFATTAPELGQNTEEILLEMGQGWEEISVLKERGVIP
jgi:crotonobetainyl-CoA:carnitine CoA-transferase CaiB-like acyl-CoA transferase